MSVDLTVIKKGYRIIVLLLFFFFFISEAFCGNIYAIYMIRAEVERPRTERIAFRMKSEVEIVDDGFRWRKYGKKSVKNSPNPRCINTFIRTDICIYSSSIIFFFF